MPGNANQGQRLKNTGIRFPSAPQLLTRSRSFSEGSARCPNRRVTPAGCPLPSLVTSLPREPTARLREPLGSDSRTNVLFKFRLGNGVGLAASAPPAGGTVLQGPPLGPHTLPTPKIPPLQSHPGVWRALGRVTHSAVSLADLSLKWAQGTCGPRDPERIGWVSTWQVKRTPETDAEDNLTTQGLTP